PAWQQRVGHSVFAVCLLIETFPAGLGIVPSAQRISQRSKLIPGNKKFPVRLLHMTNFIPIFPLGVVVFPGEDLNLHIFEERYKQMIAWCFEQKKPYGISVVIDNELKDVG